MSLCFAADAGGTADTDAAVPSYAGRPTAISIGVWFKAFTGGAGLNFLESTAGAPLNLLQHNDFTAWSPFIARGYSTTNLQSYAGGRTIDTTQWLFWMACHSGVGTDSAVFVHEAGGDVDFVATQTNGVGTLGTTTGGLLMGFNATGLQLPLKARVADMFILDYVPTSTERTALAAGGSPMNLAVQPVWYNRMRTNGTGSDAQVGTLSVSGAVFNTTDNPTVAAPGSVRVPSLMMMGCG